MPTGAALFAELLQPGFLARLLGSPAARRCCSLAAVLQLAGFVAIRRLSPGGRVSGRGARERRGAARLRGGLRSSWAGRESGAAAEPGPLSAPGARIAHAAPHRRCASASPERIAGAGLGPRLPVPRCCWRRRPRHRRGRGVATRRRAGRARAGSRCWSPSACRRPASSLPTRCSSGRRAAGAAGWSRRCPTRSTCSRSAPPPAAGGRPASPSSRRAGGGPLAEELRITVAELSCGVPQAEALRRCAARVPGQRAGGALRRDRALAPLRLAARRAAAPPGGALRRDQRRAVEERAARAAPKIQLVVALVLVPSVLLMIAAGLIANADLLLAGFWPGPPNVFAAQGHARSPRLEVAPRVGYSSASSRRRLATAAVAARIASSSAALFLWPLT